MQEPLTDSKAEDSAPDIHHMFMLIAEAKVALRSLSEIVPNPEAVEGLIHYVRDALDTVADGLALLTPRH